VALSRGGMNDLKTALMEWGAIMRSRFGNPRNFEQPLFEMYNDVAVGIIKHINGTEKMEKNTMINFLKAIEKNKYTFDETIPGMTNEIKNWLEVHVIPEPNYNSMANKGGRRKSRRANRKSRKSRRANRRSRNKRFK
jgi:hypothetical protein